MLLIPKLGRAFIFKPFHEMKPLEPNIRELLIYFFQSLEFNREPTADELETFEIILEQNPYFQKLLFTDWTQINYIDPDTVLEINFFINFFNIHNKFDSTLYLSAPPIQPDFELLSPKPKPSPVRSEKRK